MMTGKPRPVNTELLLLLPPQLECLPAAFAAPFLLSSPVLHRMPVDNSLPKR